jgi:hypothetical protein
VVHTAKFGGHQPFDFVKFLSGGHTITPLRHTIALSCCKRSNSKPFIAGCAAATHPFGGEINLKAAQSKPWWPPRVVPPKGAPNILLIMTDDVGFGAPSTFGGVIPTPALDRIAATRALGRGAFRKPRLFHLAA